MKELFSIETGGFFWMEEENAVYSVFDRQQNTHRFYDENGCELPEYTRPLLSEETINDDTFEETEDEALIYNKYGVACGDNCLVDIAGKEIPDTKLNCEDDCYKENRYFSFALLSQEQCDSIDQCGTAGNITLDIYDTKLRKYVAKGVPECKLSITGFDGENEVVVAAVQLIRKYDKIELDGKGTLIAHKGNKITVYDFYQD